jgi:hypothetical protein
MGAGRQGDRAEDRLKKTGSSPSRRRTEGRWERNDEAWLPRDSICPRGNAGGPCSRCPRPGRRRVLPRPHRQPDRGLQSRGRSRHLCAPGGASHRQAHSRQSDRRGAQHAGCRQRGGGEPRLQRVAQGRLRARAVRRQHHDRPAARRHPAQVRRACLQLDRCAVLRLQRLPLLPQKPVQGDRRRAHARDGDRSIFRWS